MSEQFFVKQMPNGLTLLGQPMAQVSSAALTFLVPGGSSHDDDATAGAAAVAAEWVLRGAGERDTRQLNDALDALGCQHHEGVQSEHMQFSAAQLGRNLLDVLTILVDVIRRPTLTDDAFEPCLALTVQDLASLEDEPAQKCNILLRERFYPLPLGRCIYGTNESLAAMTPAAVRPQIKAHFGPRRAILAVAGAFQWDELCAHVDKLLGDWTQTDDHAIHLKHPPRGVTHIQKDSAQVHLALAHATVPAGDHMYYPARMAETILSGGMSGRLFTEVREKRGLVYHVSTRYHSLKAYAGMFTYAGTTTAKAQETLEVTVGELRRLSKGIEKTEIDRARTQLKSALVMQGESTSARANALAGDWYHLGRLRSLEEISAAIDAITIDQVLEYLHTHPAHDFTILSIGPEPLNVVAIGQ